MTARPLKDRIASVLRPILEALKLIGVAAIETILSDYTDEI